MAEEVKFSQEEMSQLTELQQTYTTIQNTFGQLSVNRIRLEQELSSLDEADVRLKSDFAATQQKEREFVDSINKKYGDGNLDLNTGVFTPRPIENTPDKTL